MVDGFTDGGNGHQPTNPTGDASSTGDASGDDAGDGGALPRSCGNAFKDGNETDTDCGGNECGKCLDGKACIANTDCRGGSCVNNVCATAACNDNTKNGQETDVDCGGSGSASGVGACGKCTLGKSCKVGTDCVSGSCVNSACACPAGMATVSKAGGGGAYCIDAAEVTKGQYHKFVTANVAASSQDAFCRDINPVFPPRNAYPPQDFGSQGTAFANSLPVHYVNWCSAVAYCKWAGKQLCGKVDGGAVLPADGNDATKSAWFNACSNQNVNTFPYGSTFLAGKCNGSGESAVGDRGPIGTGTGKGYGLPDNFDQDIYTVVRSDSNGNFTAYEHVDCQGGVGGVYQMRGNVAEWENSCESNEPDAECQLRGGSYAAENDQTLLRCSAKRSLQRVPPLPAPGEVDPLADVGFRCCQY